MADPHKPPSRKEVRDSGAADWVEQAMEKHQAKQAKLGSIFGETQKDMRMEKDALASVWNKAAEEEEDKGPDLFADERSKGVAEKKKLASVWDQDRAEREAEEAQLRNLFGGGGSSGGGKKKR
ncbi:hypothetical protein JST97_09105 [bacterium]|nr:hypothetical protein [bacterium]